MRDTMPVQDIDSEADIKGMLDIAEVVHGILSLTHDGRLIIYDCLGDLEKHARTVNAIDSGFLFRVEKLDDTTLGFKL
jgi:hypothetical protein